MQFLSFFFPQFNNLVEVSCIQHPASLLGVVGRGQVCSVAPVTTLISDTTVHWHTQDGRAKTRLSACIMLLFKWRKSTRNSLTDSANIQFKTSKHTYLKTKETAVTLIACSSKYIDAGITMQHSVILTLAVFWHWNKKAWLLRVIAHSYHKNDHWDWLTILLNPCR